MKSLFRGLRDKLSPLPRITDVADADIVFFMPVFRDAPVAFRALARLRQHYPGSRVIVLSDGDADFPGDLVQDRFGAEFVAGENLYGAEHGGRMVHRILDHYMRAPARFLVRTDSDARMDRRFGWMPGAMGVYGTTANRSGTVQGGCVLFTDDAARKLHGEGVYLSDKLLDAALSWGRYSTPDNLAKKIAQKRVAYDKVLHWGCVEAGVPVRDYDEVYSVWKPDEAAARRIENEDGRYAIVHPSKMTDDPAPEGLPTQSLPTEGLPIERLSTGGRS